MPLISGGGGGSAFNGGTITRPLEIDQGASAASDQVLLVKDSGSNVVFGVTPDGRMVLFSNGSRQQATLTISDNTPGNAGTLRFDSFNGVSLEPEASSEPILQLLPLTGHTGTVLEAKNAAGSNIFVVDVTNKIGFFATAAAAQQTLAPGSATPEQIATVLQTYGLSHT